MEFRVRPLNWDVLDGEGLPKDAKQVMTFFNRGLRKNAYSFIPRRIEITKEEIVGLWVPSKDKNITYVAEIGNKIIGSGTVLVDSRSNKYSLESERNDNNEYSVLVDLDYFDKGVELKITKAMLREVKGKKIKVISHVYSTNKVLLDVMNKLECKFIKKVKLDRYVSEGLNEDIYLYGLG